MYIVQAGPKICPLYWTVLYTIVYNSVLSLEKRFNPSSNARQQCTSWAQDRPTALDGGTPILPGVILAQWRWYPQQNNAHNDALVLHSTIFSGPNFSGIKWVPHIGPKHQVSNYNDRLCTTTTTTTTTHFCIFKPELPRRQIWAKIDHPIHLEPNVILLPQISS